MTAGGSTVFIPATEVNPALSTWRSRAENSIEDFGEFPLCPEVLASSLRKPPFPFLQLPRELRDKVYKEVVTVSQNFNDLGSDYPSEKTFPGLNILSVSRTVRKEAWEMLANGNIWIQVRLCGPPSLFQSILREVVRRDENGKRYPSQVFTTYGYSRDSVRRLKESSVITVCLGDSSGIKAKDKLLEHDFRGLSLLIPYQSSQWPHLIDAIGESASSNSIHITCRNNVLQDTSISGRAFERIIKGLFTIRNAAQASSSGCSNALDALVSKMQSPLRCDVDYLEFGLEFQKMGEYHLGESDHSEAMYYFDTGACILEHGLGSGLATVGSLPPHQQTATMRAIIMHLVSSFSHAVNLMISRRFESSKRGMLPEAYMLSLLGKSLEYACASLWLGASDCERRQSHWEAGTAFALMSCISNEALIERYGFQKQQCLEAAARHLWYALYIDHSNDSTLPPNPMYLMICHQIGRDPEEPWPLATIEIPALGTWTSDPQLLSVWGAQTVMMRFYRQRAWPHMGETMNANELRQLYSNHGISWTMTGDDRVQLSGPGMESWASALARLFSQPQGVFARYW
ncbi:hypothetical protein PFICI_13424 [Pestalotiopsis fici W106-1]|uniref:Uncharacterized protein n=1 Tax=Pestalotiopsis fici (strain W106-1 / CGMCC3.15140) TaxID=1229662 RepID=W3WLY6_PESFW|nr:uncharacterized protein PFICI_13424 [Pestalotiopsis fici W106-1]ETS74940.1 hypothetical protein PFICI_13424 [Pestalotiopsis fici W106-1]